MPGAWPGTSRASFKRRRGFIACLACRERKVRCNFTMHGGPCLNCCFDKTDCIVKRRAGKCRRSLSCSEFQISDVKYPLSTGCLSTGSENAQGESAFESIEADAETHVTFSYYQFLDSDIPSNITPDDFNFLKQNKCFYVPARPLLNELVEQYFLHVHPNLPILNEGVFWDIYTANVPFNDEMPRLSLFVFQAMLFSSCSFLTAQAVQKLGFTNTRSARAAYYRRAKLLFDFDAGRDPISNAQGALLISYCTPSRNFNTNSFWLGMAIHFARYANAHQYHTRGDLTLQQRNVRKRLWWCCILRDRILSLETRRPLQISASDFDTQRCQPTDEDFEDEIENSLVYDAETKNSLIQLLVVHFELAVLLTEVVTIAYPFDQGQTLSLDDETEFHRSVGHIEACHYNLDRWYERETVGLRMLVPNHDAHELIILYKNLMYLYYHSAKVSLYHQMALMVTKGSMDEGTCWEWRYHIDRHLEKETSDIESNIHELIELNLAKYLPISVVASHTNPLFLHARDVYLSPTVSQGATKQRQMGIFCSSDQTLEPWAKLGSRVDLTVFDMAMAIHGHEVSDSPFDWAGEIFFGTRCSSEDLSDSIKTSPR